MAYWLSCASNLLFLIQKSKKLDGGSTVPEPPPSTMPHEEMIKVLIFIIINFIDSI